MLSLEIQSSGRIAERILRFRSFEMQICAYETPKIGFGNGISILRENLPKTIGLVGENSCSLTHRSLPLNPN
jgi:hypothetical protein